MIERTGRATVVNDFGLVTPGAACSVRVRPAFGEDQNCRVAVRCGGVSLYGGESGGFGTCVVEGGGPIAARDPLASDKDRDPVIEVNLAQGTAEVSDVRPTQWAVKITLDPEKR